MYKNNEGKIILKQVQVPVLHPRYGRFPRLLPYRVAKVLNKK
jgi:hypothetical protein